MTVARDRRRLPHSVRKYLRAEKARLRRTLPPDEAERAVEQLDRRVRRAVMHPERGDDGEVRREDRPDERAHDEDRTIVGS